jgi:hypothetical protein
MITFTRLHTSGRKTKINVDAFYREIMITFTITSLQPARSKIIQLRNEKTHSDKPTIIDKQDTTQQRHKSKDTAKSMK